MPRTPEETPSSPNGSRAEPHPDSRGTPPTPLPPLDSLNVLLQRYFRDMQDSRTFHNDMLRRLVRKLTTMERPGWLGQITVQVLTPADPRGEGGRKISNALYLGN